MRILVFGAGPLGSLLAAHLKQGGLNVTLLARGKRYENIREHGLRLKSWRSGNEETIQIELIESLQADDCYDLIIVVMRKNSSLKILPILASNPSENVLFLMNNAAGPDELVNALGAKRIMMGFMGAAGYRENEKIVYLNAEPDRPATIHMGEIDGRMTARLEKIASLLEEGRYIKVQLESNMDAWLKYHVALLFPAFAPALYLCGNDNYRFGRTRDALVLAWRGIREALQVLRKLRVPVEPPGLKNFMFLPEPVAIWMLHRLVQNPRMEVALIRHAEVIRDEIQQLNSEFMRLVQASGLFTPTIQFLITQFNGLAQPLPDGSRSLKLNWSGVFIPLMLLIVLVLTVMLIV